MLRMGESVTTPKTMGTTPVLCSKERLLTTEATLAVEHLEKFCYESAYCICIKMSSALSPATSSSTSLTGSNPDG